VSHLDLVNAVAVGALRGISRTRAAAVCKELSAASRGGLSLEEIVAACGRDRQADAIAREARADAAALLARAASAGISVVPSHDERYPPLLRTISDPPPVLWARGDLEALTRPAVAIVGSRAASAYAIEVAARLAADLAARGIAIVSGLARGVDGSAHRGTLSAQGRTLAVLGCGPDVAYPPEHAELAAAIAGDGVLLSEFGPGTPPLAGHFPLRNRLISGISLAVVVVEASDKSGSLITARCGLEQGRDVMAVPGSVLGGRNRGSHALLKDGAKVIETADDILEELGWPGLGQPGRSRGRDAAADQKISSKSLKTGDLLDKLTPGETYGLDELSATVGLQGSKLLPRLTEWEMQGRLVKLGSLWQRRS
jgi:DNA processing protein